MIRRQYKRAARRVANVVMLMVGMVDAVAPRTRAPLQRRDLCHQLLVVEQPHLTARHQRQRIDVNLAAVAGTEKVRNAMLGKALCHDATRKAVARDSRAAILTQHLGKLGNGLCRIERRIPLGDMKDNFKKGLNVDFRPYLILGTCNPELSYRALQAEDKIGTMLPCNVVVQQQEDGRVEVSAVDPVASMQAVTHVVLGQIAENIRSHLQHVIDEVGNATEAAGAR